MSSEELIGHYLSVGKSNTVVHGATPVADRFGDVGGAFHFDGVDDYIAIDPPPQIDKDAFSVSVWARYAPRDMRGWTNCIVAQDDGNDDDQSRRVFQLSTFMGRIVWHRMVNARDPMCKRPVRSGVWYHIVAVQEKGRHQIYLDGELQDTVQDRFWTHPAQPVQIGRKGTDEPSFFFHGDISDVRLYNRALQDQEIQSLLAERGWKASPVASVISEDSLTGRWGQWGIVMLDLRCDHAGKVTGRIMARDPGHMAPITSGRFDFQKRALRLEGTARHPDNGSAVPYLIEGRLADGELTVIATFQMKEEVNTGNYILTKDGAKGGWWRNSYLRWRMRKLFHKRRW